MKPDNVTGSGQGTGTPRDKTTNTVRQNPEDPAERHDDHRDSSSADFEAAQETPGNAAPAIRHRNRPERDKAGGHYHGPRRGRE